MSYEVQPRSCGLTQSIPALDTVAGVAAFRWEISKSRRMEEDKLILSLLARVRTWTEERKKGFVEHLFKYTKQQQQNMKRLAWTDWEVEVYSQPWTKFSISRMKTKDNFREQPDLIVIHNCVKRLNPHWVNITVQNNPFGSIMAHWGQLSHGRGKQTYSKAYSGISIVFSLDCSIQDRYRLWQKCLLLLFNVVLMQSHVMQSNYFYIKTIATRVHFEPVKYFNKL